MPNLTHNQGISNQGIVKLDGASAAPISGPPATSNPSGYFKLDDVWHSMDFTI